MSEHKVVPLGGLRSGSSLWEYKRPSLGGFGTVPKHKSPYYCSPVLPDTEDGSGHSFCVPTRGSPEVYSGHTRGLSYTSERRSDLFTPNVWMVPHAVLILLRGREVPGCLVPTVERSNVNVHVISYAIFTRHPRVSPVGLIRPTPPPTS